MSNISILVELLVIGIVVLTLVSDTKAKRTYDGYSVIRSVPQTHEQLEYLQSLIPISENEGGKKFAFWMEPHKLNGLVDVMVRPDYLKHYLHNLSERSITSEIIISDLAKEIKMTKTGINIDMLNRDLFFSNETVRAQLSPKMYHSQYQRYSAIEAKLNQLMELDERVKVEVVGKSSENRNIYLVKVSNDHSAGKPVVLIDAGHHAREWVSHSTIMYLLESLVNIDLPKVNNRRVLAYSRLDLNKFDFWFIPVVNPDGYEYSHTTDRLWRKTRSSNMLCRGSDANRNYPFHWRESGASSYVCSDTYAGSKAMSEPEVRAVVSVMDNNKSRIAMYLSLHAYSQMILSPYGYARVYPKNYEQMENLARRFMNSLKTVRGTSYKFGPSSVQLYPAAGGSDDYAHGGAGIKYSYTIELPDLGRRGFMLPASEIVPVGHETLVGIQAMIEAF